MAANKASIYTGHDYHSSGSSEALIELGQLRHGSDSRVRSKQPNAATQHTSSVLKRRTISNFWLLECICYALALGSAIAIICLLNTYDGQPIPQWRYGITLNAIISLLATVMVFTLSGAVSACLSQLKWLHLRSERPLMDFEYIENAARGPQGSLMLLCCGKGGYLASFGATLIIITLAIGPFVQQIVNNRLETTASSSAASLPIAYNYTVPGGDITQYDIALDMKAAILSGALQIQESDGQFSVPAVCTTGNCSWPRFTSLATCASCKDLTNDLTVHTRDNTTKGAYPHVIYRLPNGIYLEAYEGLSGVQMILNNTGLQRWPTSLAYKSHNNTILDMFVIAMDNETASSTVYGPWAAECILEFCAQSFTAKVTNGTFTEVREGRGIPIQKLDYPTWYTQIGARTFGVSYPPMRLMMAYMGLQFHGGVSWQSGVKSFPMFPSDVTQSVWQHLKQPPHTLDSMFTNIEQSMTRAIRTHTGGRQSLEGTSILQQSIIRVDWPWMALPVALLILVLTFCITVITATRRSGLEPWKSSTVAVLFHGFWLANNKNNNLSILTHQDEMVVAAREMFVRLKDDKGGQFLEQTRDST